MSTKIEHGYAVIIGVDANQMAHLALPAVAKDAQALYDVLVHPERCAYKRDNVQLLMGEESTKRNILEALYWLQEKVEEDPQATTVVYYSGHGMRIKESEQYYLIPYDMHSAGRVRADAIKSEKFAAEISAIGAERLLVVLDCCHAGGMDIKDPWFDGATKGPDLASAAFPIVLPEIEVIPAYTAEPGEKAVNDLLEGKGRAVLNSSTGEQVSYVRKDGEMSVFTYHLIEALTGYAPHPDNARVVFVTDVMSWVTYAVKKTAEAYGVEQTPEMRTTGVFPVALLIGGKGVPKGAGETPPDPLDPLPRIGTQVTFNQTRQTVSGQQVNIGSMQGDIGQIGDAVTVSCGGVHRKHVGGDEVKGDKITVGDISGSSGVAIGRGATSIVMGDGRSDAEEAAWERVNQLIDELNELLEQAPKEQQETSDQVAQAAQMLVNNARVDKPNPTMVEALGEGLKQTARKLGDNLPGIIELATKIAAAVAAIVNAAN